MTVADLDAVRDTAYLLVHPFFPYYMNEDGSRHKHEQYFSHVETILKSPVTKVILEEQCCMKPFTETCMCLSCVRRRMEGVREYETNKHLAQVPCQGSVILIPTRPVAPWPVNGDEAVVNVLRNYSSTIVLGSILARDAFGDLEGCVGYAYNHYKQFLPLKLDEKNSWNE